MKSRPIAFTLLLGVPFAAASDRIYRCRSVLVAVTALLTLMTAVSCTSPPIMQPTADIPVSATPAVSKPESESQPSPAAAKEVPEVVAETAADAPSSSVPVSATDVPVAETTITLKPKSESELGPASAEEILELATKATENVTSSSFRLRQEVESQGQSALIVYNGVLEGTVRGYLTLEANGQRLEILILSETAIFIRPQGSELWVQHEEAPIENPLSEMYGSEVPLNPKLVGEEEADGTASFVVEYDLDLHDLFAENPQFARFFSLDKSKDTVKQWIGKSDYLTRRMEREITLLGEQGEIASKHILEQSNFGEPVQIPDPSPYARQVSVAASDPVFEVTFSPDSSTLAACDDDGILYLWQTRDPQLGARAVDHPTQADNSKSGSLVLGLDFLSLAFSPDGQTIAAGTLGEVLLYALDDLTATPTVLAAAPRHQIEAISYSPDGKKLAAGGRDGQIHIWNTESLEDAPVVLAAHEAAIRDLLFSPDAQTLVSASEDATIKLWDVNDPKMAAQVLEGHTMPVYDLDISTDGKTLLSVGYKDAVLGWSMESPGNRPDTLIRAVDESIGKYPTLAVALSPDGKFIATADVFGEVRLWSVPAFDHPYAVFPTFSEYDIMTLDFSPDGRYLAAGQGNRFVHLWDLAPDTPPLTVVPHHTDASGDLSVQDILTRNFQAMGAAQTMRVTVGVDFQPDNENEPTTRVLTQTAIYRHPNEMYLKTEVDKLNEMLLGDRTVLMTAQKTEMLQLDDRTVLVRELKDGEWLESTSYPYSSLGSMLRVEEYAHYPYLDAVKSTEDGQAYVVAFDVRPASLLRALNHPMVAQRLDSSRTTAMGRVWIERESFLTRRVEYTMTLATPWVAAGATVNINVDGYDESVEIPVP